MHHCDMTELWILSWASCSNHIKKNNCMESLGTTEQIQGIGDWQIDNIFGLPALGTLKTKVGCSQGRCHVRKTLEVWEWEMWQDCGVTGEKRFVNSYKRTLIDISLLLLLTLCNM